jgi:hypothetical protein
MEMKSSPLKSKQWCVMCGLSSKSVGTLARSPNKGEDTFARYLMIAGFSVVVL